MVLPPLREPAIANHLLWIVRDARFAEHHAQRTTGKDLDSVTRIVRGGQRQVLPLRRVCYLDVPSRNRIRPTLHFILEH